LRTDAKENLITAIQIALQENGRCYFECAFILNISCIEETERPRLMRNILRHSRHHPAMVESGVHLNMRRELF
jgi:hypothetical protein